MKEVSPLRLNEVSYLQRFESIILPKNPNTIEKGKRVPILFHEFNLSIPRGKGRSKSNVKTYKNKTEQYSKLNPVLPVIEGALTNTKRVRKIV